MKKRANKIIIILCIIIALIAAMIFFIINKINDSYKEISSENIIINEGNEGNLQGYRNIVILGIDSNEDNYEGERRSDCIIIASLNNETKDVKLVSVYRDTYLYITDKGLDKVNHAYAKGEEECSINTLNENLDLDISEYVTINFEAVKEVIDSIGGVEITITDKEATQIKGIEKGGTYTLNGSQALQYGRIRKIDNDYARTERMRTVLIETFNKAKNIDTVKLLSLITKILPHIETNISTTEIMKIARSINDYKVTLNTGWPYEVQGITLDAWYGVPVTLEKNVSKLHEDLFNETDYEPTEKVKEYSQKIIDKTGYR